MGSRLKETSGVLVSTAVEPTRTVAEDDPTKPNLIEQALDREQAQSKFSATKGELETSVPNHTGAQSSELSVRTNVFEDQPHVSTINKKIEAIDFNRVFDHPLSQKEAETTVATVSDLLGVLFELKWSSEKSGIWAPDEPPVLVPGGLVRSSGMTADGLSLILAHEAAHMQGIVEEASADYWAARYGLRLLWGEETFEHSISTRGLLAAFSALKFAETNNARFAVVSSDDPVIEINGAGYPTLQSRWDIYKIGILGRKMPDFIRPEPTTPESAYPDLMTRKEAAAYLGVSVSWLAHRTRLADGPMEVNIDGGKMFVREQLGEYLALRRSNSGRRHIYKE